MIQTKKWTQLITWFFIAGFLSMPAAMQAEETVELTNVLKPRQLMVFSDRIYIADGDSSVHVYALEGVKYLKTFGTKGEGPGEFKFTPYLNHGNKGIMAGNPGKLLFFSKEGEFQEEIKLPFNYHYNNYPLLPVKGNYVGIQLAVNEEKKRFEFIGKVYSKDLQLIREFYDGGVPNLLPPPPPGVKPTKKIDNEIISDCLDIAVGQDRIFVADTRKGFYIGVFNEEGKHLLDIRKDEKIEKVPGEFKEEIMAELKQSKNWEKNKAIFNYVFRDKFPAFFSIKIRDGKLYVLTYKQKDKKYEVIAMDLEGQIEKRWFAFPCHPLNRYSYMFGPYNTTYDIMNNRIYTLQENLEKEVWELHINDLN